MDHRRLIVPIAAIALATPLLAPSAMAQQPAAPAAAPAAAPGQAPAAGRAGRGARGPQATPAAPQPSAAPSPAPAATPAQAPAAGRGGRGAQAPAVVSPEVLSDGRITFRIRAPQAVNVELNAADIPGLAAGGRGAATQSGRGPGTLTRLEDGIWSVTVGPVEPGAYRYRFVVDGVQVFDPANPLLSESNAYTSSMVVVPGSDFQDTKQVPHGAVAAVTYYSTVLKTFRRMHVYTPPGYELGGGQKFPVFYLLHGALDCDETWTSVGRAGFILDNLLATKKLKPMIVVMPAGHQPGQPGFGGGAGRGAAPDPAAVPMFTQEFMADMMPYVESHYRTINDRAHRAIAGLSMGGGQTLDIAFRHLDRFAYIGVFSSGASLAGGGRAPAAAPGGTAQPRPGYEDLHKADLDNPALKKGTKLIWLSTGVDDSLMSSTKATVDMLKKHGFEPVFKESPGAHTWINWRNYLHEFAPLLFQ